MGFTLTISEGNDRGREYTFDQPEVCIGRTAENDVVLTEAGVSRRHVMIREEGGKFVVQDLGSANGTKVNGAPITEDQVKDGDSITVGPVTFSFVSIQTAAGGDSTRIFDPKELEKKMAATKKAKEQAAAAPGATGQRRAMTAAIPLGNMRPSTGGKPGPGGAGRTSSAAVGGNKALAKKSSGAVAAPAPNSPASARARARRQATTPWAKARLWWEEADKKKRTIAGAVAGVVLLGGATGLFFGLRGGGNSGPSFASDDSNHIFDIGPEPGNDIYGTGIQDVTRQTADKAQFKFIFPVTAKKATATLHFTSGGVAKSEEVDVAVNTIHVGFVERTFGDQAKTQELAIPSKYLHANAENRIVFDNLRNPSKDGSVEPWMVGKVWIDVQQLPEDKPENLKRKAQEQITVGDRAWEFRKVGADNTYKAWKAYKEAKLYLEALDEKIDEYDVVKLKIKDCERELEDICRIQMLKGTAAEQQGHPEDAIKIYKGALQYFPEKDHHCYADLHDKLQGLE